MSNVISFDHGFKLFNNAHVEVQCNDSGSTVAVISDGNDYIEHRFGENTEIAKAASYDANKVSQRLSGGKFFTCNNQLISFRDGSYNGFTHSEDGIKSLIEHVGFSQSEETKHTSLNKMFSSVEIHVDQYEQGGEMDNQLLYSWDPFRSFVRGNFMIYRRVCSNGMMGMGSFVNTKVPVVSDWVEHLQIANAQIQNKVTSTVKRRMVEMAKNRATVGDCQRVVDACVKRASDVNVSRGDNQYKTIKNIALVCDPKLHLSKHYKDEFLTDRRLSKQVESHLTEFTVWNMLTELASHTTETKNNTDNALYLHANELLIERGYDNFKQTRNNVGKSNINVKFDNVDAAFSGDLLAA